VALVRPLTANQLATSLRLATADPASVPPGVGSEPFEKQIQALEERGRPLASSFATSGGDSQVGVSEALLFSNGKRITTELLSAASDSLVKRLEQTARPVDVVDLAVRNVLSRPPDDEELRVLGAYLEGRTDRPDEARRQLVWALLTDSEFRFNH
jgi:hypothetical protein